MQPSLKTRGEDRKRLKRYEPFFSPNGLTRAGYHPHGDVIRPGDYCGHGDCVNQRDQTAIDRSEAPKPENPEDRAARRIAEYKQAIKDLDPAKHPRLIAGLQAEIEKQRKIIDEWAGVPTVYKPHPKLKGGK